MILSREPYGSSIVSKSGELLTPEIGANLDPVGIMLAVVAGAGWASFIFCSQRLGRTVGGHGALPVAVLICSAILIPVSGWHAVSVSLAHPSALLTVMIGHR